MAALMKNLGNPQIYKLRLHNRLPNRLYLLEGEDGNKNFTAPASQKGRPKLYTVSSNGKLHYVGITSQPMSMRLRSGFKATGKHGYWGYKWKEINSALILHVWVLENLSHKKAYRELETIEAEVIFLCRKRHHQWPAWQNEIHFHPSKPFHRKLASRIYEYLQCSFKNRVRPRLKP
jgi:hypothetical protein